MSLFKPTPLTPKQFEKRKELYAKGRVHFVLYSGVLGWGMSCFIATTLWGDMTSTGGTCRQRTKSGWTLSLDSLTAVRLEVEENQLVDVFGEIRVRVDGLKGA